MVDTGSDDLSRSLFSRKSPCVPRTPVSHWHPSLAVISGSMPNHLSTRAVSIPTLEIVATYVNVMCEEYDTLFDLR